MKLYRTTSGNILRTEDSKYFTVDPDWDVLINNSDLYNHLKNQLSKGNKLYVDEAEKYISEELLAPIGSQEVWAAGVTYLQSRDARMEEAKAAGSGDFYDKVYDAERPELFFKSLPHRVAGPGQSVNIRADSAWNVPEPELTLFINRTGNIAGYTVGNDMSSRSIEGENPLYLPQAKVYERSAAIGPCLYVTEDPLSEDTKITMTIKRKGNTCFSGKTSISRMKRSLTELSEYLLRGLHFPNGCFLMTGTCLVPDDDFTLEEGDYIEMSIEHIGTLANIVTTLQQGRRESRRM